MKNIIVLKAGNYVSLEFLKMLLNMKIYKFYLFTSVVVLSLFGCFSTKKVNQKA